ncbi:MAG: bifunctional methylenetetrahydrofolate dehydrogenase/methenyltetrahydrofolate cyclohydrolase [Halothiobacillus sp. 24-54-40]|jgi:methylenetetrahydrofolate dehydrogenase (NADP+)/methenyltetrahydrofolate cyclohydrolase|nr:MAG: bifunctional methylenetetrahydrofolate dehydrogenase/methenyltetrahydrofolate cyclohydrolase [Halothiobacillus sp. 35-54-62]OYZ86364.1 MAG: bifunctional methylenetetrahydrofolate dehydrogenase/methenyltetrahydrofolate cyclohydrolase [Halothiobacillus sp. 24-54-40]OZA80208.1 MAG: bifunctional methylenetetrahydrofolate dehydrogenase/methenyltetrahydrofolate cyclohydrolase [Halothiobacillus sp. 39-53-45]HQS01724.1 bifunctional methylenetetrahydrofolate dehydrogenase/methenyltetrahydrofolate
MTAQILDGKSLSNRMQTALGEEIRVAIAQGIRPPGIAVVQVGDDAASSVYVANKRKTCKKLGIYSQSIDLPSTLTQAELNGLIDQFNRDPSIDGILVQLPLPAHLNANEIIERIAPHKDVDGFHPENIGKLAIRQPALRPCTPFGVMKLLETAELNLYGMNAVVVGASNIVGRPMALELLLAGATVTITHRFTKNLAEHIARADLVVAAAGKQGLIQGEWIKPGAVVVDVGIHRQADGSLSGDVDFATAAERAAWITPVPGGVGPMTIAMLMFNTVQAWREHTGQPQPVTASVAAF